VRAAGKTLASWCRQEIIGKSGLRGSRAKATWEIPDDMAADRTETHDLAAKRPELVKKMDADSWAWWKDCKGSEWNGKPPKNGDEE